MKEHKVVVAGCGGMSNEWLDYAAKRDNVEIVGLVDIFEESAQSMAKKRGLDVPTFTDLSVAIEETGANLVFDVTIPSSHKQIVTTALKAGCNVFGEKPMAESMKDAREIIKLTEQTGKRYSVMQNRRYLKQIRALHDVLKTGAIGTIGSIHANFFLGPHFGGFREEMDNVLILDMAIHTFDQARFITGADPVSVYCHEYNPPGSWYKGNASAICIFEMNDGSVFSYNGSWCAQGLGTSWESEWRVTGSEGSAKWDGFHTPIVEVVDEEQSSSFIHAFKALDVPERWEGQSGHFGCLDEMFDALEHGRRAETDCTDNIKSIAMVLGAVESARTHKKVFL
ncbi:putative dehydrogenase [Pullulanibacillus pueri]|uniref:Oxidoreductase n=1 Tax=Pullulanibacillus pueri TaxID=1437324 RepID=A0A8J2ZS38_9BACL|nr:Gfo/Idh/MocA family oxidoreductase [Pullulanibacillus pueri]MBM7679913.1 putative dehydrogenase [Pullulanibacillus pueri]GGH73460.1 oxidoreductase [Pullulanibacillus pueri]